MKQFSKNTHITKNALFAFLIISSASIYASTEALAVYRKTLARRTEIFNGLSVEQQNAIQREIKEIMTKSYPDALQIDSDGLDNLNPESLGTKNYTRQGMDHFCSLNYIATYRLAMNVGTSDNPKHPIIGIHRMEIPDASGKIRVHVLGRFGDIK